MLEGAKNMQRRTLLTCGSAAVLAAPRTIRSETMRTLRFIPSVDLPSVDPVSTTTLTTLLYGNTIYEVWTPSSSRNRKCSPVIAPTPTAHSGS